MPGTSYYCECSGMPTLAAGKLPVVDSGVTVAPSQEVLVPSDAVDVSAKTAKGIYCVEAGTLTTTGMQAGAAAIPRTVLAGQYFPMQVRYVNVGTTAGLAEAWS